MNEPLSPEREAEITARACAATKGPWTVELEQCDCSDGLCSHGTYVSAVYAEGERRTEFADFTDSDWQFVIRARDAVPELLAELDRVRAERDQYATQLDGLHLAQWEDKQETAESDTLPAWLYQRFMPDGTGWGNLDDDQRSYWEHQARAVRRAVARNGFKVEGGDR